MRKVVRLIKVKSKRFSLLSSIASILPNHYLTTFYRTLKYYVPLPNHCLTTTKNHLSFYLTTPNHFLGLPNHFLLCFGEKLLPNHITTPNHENIPPPGVFGKTGAKTITFYRQRRRSLWDLND
jgi:hypothetical protein